MKRFDENRARFLRALSTFESSALDAKVYVNTILEMFRQEGYAVVKESDIMLLATQIKAADKSKIDYTQIKKEYLAIQGQDSLDTVYKIGGKVGALTTSASITEREQLALKNLNMAKIGFNKLSMDFTPQQPDMSFSITKQKN